jgi:hypothetical protein
VKEIRQAARALCLTLPFRLVQAGECEGFIPCPIHLVPEKAFALQNFPYSKISRNRG